MKTSSEKKYCEVKAGIVQPCTKGGGKRPAGDITSSARIGKWHGPIRGQGSYPAALRTRCGGGGGGGLGGGSV